MGDRRDDRTLETRASDIPDCDAVAPEFSPEKKQEDQPTENGRKKDGTFAPGWKGGPGRPPGTKDRCRRVFSELLAANDYETIRACFLSLKSSALKGDTQAAKIILEYGLGKPDQAIELSGGLNLTLADFKQALERERDQS